MPKERRDRSVSHDRYEASPFKCGTSHNRQPSPKIPSQTDDSFKEWEDARCPVCMEHPHNAVLLMCSSHDKGCRPYMCDTSRRHSNCLDQFRKSFAESSSTISGGENIQLSPENSAQLLPENSALTQPSELAVSNMSEQSVVDEMHHTTNDVSCENQSQPKLVCPLCRGMIKKWIVNEPARHFMNAKLRNCSCETCSFSGNYANLRKHARQEHPLVRPSEAAPERQRTWRRMERQRDIGDLLSTLQSSFGDDRVDDSVLPIDDGGWLTVFFLIRVLRPESSTRSSSWSGSTRVRAQSSFRRRSTRLWGESYEVETESSSRDEDNDQSDDGFGRRTRRRQNLRQTTPDNNLP